MKKTDIRVRIYLDSINYLGDNGHEDEDHGDYINKDGKEVYVSVICIEDEQTERSIE